MAGKKRIDIRAPERALLTDTLPYEIPIFYTNANLAILAMQARLKKCQHNFHTKFLLSQSDGTKPTRPLSFEIRRVNQLPRRLSLAHPISQHRICQLYEKYDQFISNVCGRSSISLRYPSRVATHYVDPRFAEKAASATGTHADEDPVGFRDQSRWASTYFSYRDYSLSHKFFESEEFLELERRYSHLLKLDISRCFDSIYTHCIEWSMRGKDFSKTYLPKGSKLTFEASFDSAIRHGNWNETHGILIGPEYSRVFSEVLLQSADRSVLSELGDLSSSCIVKRYIDDYYIFSNSPEVLGKVEDIIRRALLAFNLHLNIDKREILCRPFVSKISVARSSVASAIDDFFDRTLQVTDALADSLDPQRIERAKNALMSRLRRLSVELSTPYERFASFALTVIKKKLAAIRDEIIVGKPIFSRGHLARLSWLISIMRVTQFLYSTDHRATTSVKLASIYSLLIELSSKLDCARAPLERQILDGLRDASMGQSSLTTDEVTRINHICSVDLLLMEDRRIELADMLQYIGTTTDTSAASMLSTFQLIAILFLCKRRQRFAELLTSTTAEIERRVFAKSFRPTLIASDAILLAEAIACPYIDVAAKVRIIKHCHVILMGAPCINVDAQKIAADATWITFTDWGSNTSLASMLARKELTPAYE